MKTVNVTLTVQLDVPNGSLGEVQDALDNINLGLQRDASENYAIQLFVNDISSSDITLVENDEEE
jgi:hypothetical protein